MKEFIHVVSGWMVIILSVILVGVSIYGFTHMEEDKDDGE